MAFETLLSSLFFFLTSLIPSDENGTFCAQNHYTQMKISNPKFPCSDHGSQVSVGMLLSLHEANYQKLTWIRFNLQVPLQVTAKNLYSH